MSTQAMAGRQGKVSVTFCVAHPPSARLPQHAQACLAVYQSMRVLEQMGSCVMKSPPLTLPRSRGVLVGSFRIAYKRQYRYIVIFHSTLMYLHESEIQFY